MKQYTENFSQILLWIVFKLVDDFLIQCLIFNVLPSQIHGYPQLFTFLPLLA